MGVSDEVRAQVLELRASGRSIRDVASTLNITRHAVVTASKGAAPAMRSDVPFVPDATVERETEIPEPAVEHASMISDADADKFATSITTPPENAADAAATDALVSRFSSKVGGGEGRSRVPASDAGVDALLNSINSKIRKPRGRKAPAPPADDEAPADLPPPAPKPKKEAPSPLEKGMLIGQITQLVDTYGALLTLHVSDGPTFLRSLPSKNVTELKTLYDTLNHAKSVHNGANALFHLFGTLAGAVEMAGSKFLKLRTEGYQSALLQQERELRLIFSDIASERIDSIKRIQSPEARLAFLMCQTLMVIDSRNRALKSSGGAAPPSTGDLQEKYGDL